MGRHGGSRRLVSDRGLMVISVWVSALLGAGQLGTAILGLGSPAVIRVSVAMPGGHYREEAPGGLPAGAPQRLRGEIAAVASSGPGPAAGALADEIRRLCGLLPHATAAARNGHPRIHVPGC